MRSRLIQKERLKLRRIGRIMGWFKRLINWKKSIENPEYEIEDFSQVIYDRDDLQIHNKGQREEYVRGCLSQIGEATRELENLQFEYNMVTSYLKDMEEIEVLPDEERKELEACAQKIDELEEKQSGYLKRVNRMSDIQFRQMERMEEEAQEGYEKLVTAEEYQELVRRDLKKLDGEKHAYLFRKSELKRLISDTRTMAIVCTVAVILCMIILLVLQFGFKLDTKIGYLVTTAAGALAITIIFVKHSDSLGELARVENGISRIIQLQNTVKIRYVNNTHLLEYLYIKYNVSSAGELAKSWEQYMQERDERKSYRQAEKDLDQRQKDLLHVLRRYQVKDPLIWLHQTAAILDRKEMVEIRHNLIIRRQSLRRRMDYNKEVIAGKAQAEIKDLVETYPKYANDILKIVEEYERNFS